MNLLKNFYLTRVAAVAMFMLLGLFGVNAQITTNPSSQEACYGTDDAEYRATTTYSGTKEWCWQADTGDGVWRDIPGGGCVGTTLPQGMTASGFTGVSVDLNIGVTADACTGWTQSGTMYRAILTKISVGRDTTSPATLTWVAKPDTSVIVTPDGSFASNLEDVQPDTVCEGGNTWVKVQDFGHGNTTDACLTLGTLTYQWQSSTNGTSWSNISVVSNPTADDDSLVITGLELTDDSTLYRCVVNNKCTGGSVLPYYSDTFTVRVDPIPSARFLSPLVINTCIGDSFDFQVEIFNALNNNGTPTGWSAYFDNSGLFGRVNNITHLSGGSAPFDSINGIGNTTFTFRHLGIDSAGVYTISLDSVRNDSSTSACLNDTLLSSITINVYPKPVAWLSTPDGRDTIDYCIGSGANCITLNVDSANFDGTPVDWVVWLRDSSANGSATSTFGGTTIDQEYTGSGNSIGTITLCPPNDLLNGRYWVIIDSIKLRDPWTGAGDTCKGRIREIHDSVLIQAIPTPIATFLDTNSGFPITNADTFRMCEGDSLGFGIKVDSAVWNVDGDESDSLKWVITITDPTGTITAPLTSTLYAGDTTYNFGTGPLGPGSYKISMGSIRFDTIGRGDNKPPVLCENQLDSFFIIEVVPNPTAEFLVNGMPADSMTLCQYDPGPTFDISVANALMDGDSVDWEIYFTDTSSHQIMDGQSQGGVVVSYGVGSGSITGSGPVTPTFNVPTNMQPGIYTIIIDSIKTVGTAPICSDTFAGAVDSFKIVILPKPDAYWWDATADVAATDGRICRGTQFGLRIKVDSTEFVPGDSASWTLTYTAVDSATGAVVASGFPASPLTGHGDTLTGIYNTSTAMPAGVYYFILNEIITDSGCVRQLNDSIKLIIDEIPFVKIDDIDQPVCDGDQATVFYTIDSATVGDSVYFTYLVTRATRNVGDTLPLSPDTVALVLPTVPYSGSFTTDDVLPYAGQPYLIDFSPIVNVTTGCVAVDSMADSSIFVHPLPTAMFSDDEDDICSGLFDPVTGATNTNFQDSATLLVDIMGATVGAQVKDWTLYYSVVDTTGGSSSVTANYTTSGSGNQVNWAIYAQDTALRHFDTTGAQNHFLVILDSIKITSGQPLCETLNAMDTGTINVNPNPWLTFDVQDSTCAFNRMIVPFEMLGIKASEEWQFKYSIDPTPYAAVPSVNNETPVPASANFPAAAYGTDTTTTDNFETSFLTATGFNYIWTDTIFNNTTGCFYNPHIFDSTEVFPPTVPGTIEGTTTVCADTNSGILYIKDYTGTVLFWEASYDEGFTWDTIRTSGNAPENRPVTFSAAFDTLYYTDKTFKTRYRALIQSGPCPPKYTDTAAIYVLPRPVVTIADYSDEICNTDSARLELEVSDVPTSNGWTVYYSTTNPTTSGTYTDTASGTFVTWITGLTSGTTSVITIDSIINTTTGCVNNELISTTTDSVEVSPNSDAGVMAGADTVCKDVNSGVVTVSGIVGDVVKWQSSIDGGASWVDIGSTDTFVTYNNLSDTIWYRVIVQSGSCEPDTNMTPQMITVIEQPIASISGSDTICPGTALTYDVTVGNSYGGTWEIEVLTGSVTDTISNTGDGTFSFTTQNLFSTSDITLKQIWISAPALSYPACMNGQIDNPGTATATIIDQATATINTAPDSICNGSDATIGIIVSNILASDSVYVYYSIDNVLQPYEAFKGPGNKSFTIDASLLTAANPSTNYTVRLDSVINATSTEPCIGVVADSVIIRVDTNSVGGTTLADATVCSGDNAGTITLSGHVKDVVRWESSEDSITWSVFSNTTTSISYSNLTNSTFYRAVVDNGACGIKYSDVTTITVRELPLATVSGGDSICEGSTDDVSITIENALNAADWYIEALVGTTKDTLMDGYSGILGTLSGSFPNYTLTTTARTTTSDVVLKSIWTGAKTAPFCVNSLNNTATTTITVIPNPNATLSMPDSVCEGEDIVYTFNVSGVQTGESWTIDYTLDGAPGSISGMGSGSFTRSITSVSAPSDKLVFVTITNTGNSSACASTNTDSVMVPVNQPTVAGTIGIDTTVCMGEDVVMSQLTAGAPGVIVKWQSRKKGDATWTDINSTGTSITYTNLTDTTEFQAIYQNGICDMVASNMVTATPKAVPVATIATQAATDTICAGETATLSVTVTGVDAGDDVTLVWTQGTTQSRNRVTLTSSPFTFDVTTVALNTTQDIEIDSIITHPVASGQPSCANALANPATATITVIPNPNATLNVPDSVCEGEVVTITFDVNGVATGEMWTMTYTLEGVAGSTTGTGSGTFSASATSVSQPSDELIITSITNDANIGRCASTNTDTVTVPVNEPTVAGTIGIDTTVCIGEDVVLRQLTPGAPGSIVKWQRRKAGDMAWIDINSTDRTITYTNLTDTTEFRAIYRNGICNDEGSNVITATPKALPVATIDVQPATDTICAGETATLDITVTNVDAGDSVTITLVEAGVNKTIGYRLTSSPAVVPHTTSALNATTVVTLKTITSHPVATPSQPSCSNDLTNAASATVTVIPNPSATISSAPDTLCQGDQIAFFVNVTGVPTGDMWRLIYELEGNVDTVTGTSSGNVYIIDRDANTASSAKIELKEILNTSNIGRCKSDDTDDWDIFIFKPTDPGTIGDDDDICKGGSVTITETVATPDGSIVDWEYKAASDASWTSVGTDGISLTVTNLLETTEYRAVYKNGVCDTAHSNYVTITVTELPLATITGTTTICADATTDVDVTISNVGATQDWSITYLEGGATKTATGTGSGTVTWTVGPFATTTDITLQTIRTTSGDPQCINDTLSNNATATITVNELPNATLASLEDSVCQGEMADGQLTVNNVRTGEAWKVFWTVNGTNLDSTSGNGAGSFNFMTAALTVDPSRVALTRVVNETTGCEFTLTDFDTVRVSEPTIAGTLTDDATVCKDDNTGTLRLGAPSRGDVVKWEYSEDGGTTWSDINNTATTYTYNDLTITTQYRVLVQNGVCDAEYSNTVTITVNELPLAEIVSVGAASICENENTFVAIEVSNVTASQDWELTYLQGSMVMTLTGTGPGSDTIFTGTLTSTTDVTLQRIRITAGAPLCDNNNLVNRATTTISVIELPSATISSAPDTICVGETPTVRVVVSKVGAVETWTLSYRVNNGTAITSTNGVGPGTFTLSDMPSFNTEGANGVRLVSITKATLSCMKDLTDSVTIWVDSASVAGSLSGTTEVCLGEDGSVNLTGETGDVVKWQYSTSSAAGPWFDIANTSNTLNFTNLTVNTWYRAVVQSGVCAPAFTAAHAVRVQELPTVTITNASQNICSGASTTIDFTVGNNPTGGSYAVTYKVNGTTQTVYNGSGSTGSISVGPFTADAQIEIIKIELTGSGLGCMNTISENATVTVTENPSATLATVPDSLCEDDNISFTVTVDDVAAGTDWEITYTVDNGGTVSANQKINGTGSGTFTENTGFDANTASVVITLNSIELDNALGCNTTLTQSATILVSPTSEGGDLTATPSTICEGDAVTLTLDNEVGTVDHWEYSTDGGNTWTVTANTGTSLTTNLTETTRFRVYVVSGTCSGDYSTVAIVTVTPTPHATVSTTDVVCPGEDATFRLSVTDVPAGDNWSVTYTRNGVLVGTPVTGTGSGDFDFTVAGLPTGPGTITVVLNSITNTSKGCTNNNLTSSATARVTPNPVPAFTADNQCVGTEVMFMNTSSISEGTIVAYKWLFGDGDSSNNPDPIHVYDASGTYTVTLTAISDNGCSASVSTTITIYDNPVADFTFDNTCQNVDAEFTDASTVAGAGNSITNWDWSFGDGSTSTAQNPTHTYTASGNYDVTLVVTTDKGCTHEITKTITVYVLPDANFVAAPTCEDDTMFFINASAIAYGSMTYDWDFAGQGTSTDENPFFIFSGFGQFDVTLTATSDNGCEISITKPVTVHPKPDVSFTVDAVCIGDASIFNNTSTVAYGTIDEYYWNFGDSTFSGVENPFHAYDEPGSYTATLRAVTNEGCVDIATETAEVLPLPEVQLTANGPTEFCEGESVDLTVNSNTRNQIWTLNGTQIATGTDQITATATGWYVVRVFSISTPSCENVDSIFINVWPLPDAQAWFGTDGDITNVTDSISLGASIQLNASGGEAYSWNPITFLSNAGIADPMAERVLETTTYTVTVTDSNGCVNTASITVTVLNNFDLIPYNVVTPNGDGMNDTWIVDYIWAYPEAEVIIFNRYGQEILRTTGYQNDWDGTSANGNELPDGAYYYVITHPDFGDIVYKGVINLIRNR